MQSNFALQYAVAMATAAEEQTPGRRRRSEGKRAAILAAAEALFVTDGYERVSVDAIAARAQVSKRTVYDHFGDKQALFLRVLERVGDALVATIRTALDEELTAGREPRDALTAFARRVATETFPSSDYVTYQRLTSRQWALPQLPEPVRDRPELLLEERFAKLAAEGVIATSDPGTAARHFTALTIRLALDALNANPGARVREEAILKIIADGVDAFLRAYR
ncbi:TetR family transcriptional regulator [Pseudosporangium ferrugineum]|uniref:TetR family transcriptional regulator n=2 Tax=Pseudosporangium ferrugineum TaxID=439699 RepID=A0A2T0RMI0_9ACTN|nr:TetR family transcriptional regulator [Pseudosporangium ferrugineum]